MTPEQKQQILRDAPEGASHYSPNDCHFYKLNTVGTLLRFTKQDSQWHRLYATSLNDVCAISLDSLREPEQAELKQLSAQQKREKILRLALEYISADPENHDAQSIVKDHIDTAKKALAHAASIPDENWSEEEEKRQTLVDQNGNTAEHYAELDKQQAMRQEVKAQRFLEAGIKHMAERAKTYDKPEGERSMGATVKAFEAVTGITLTEEQGWLFQVLLKAVRSQQGGYRADNYEDGAAYFALTGEAASKARGEL